MTDGGTPEDAIADVVDERIFDDPLWSRLSQVTDEILYNPPNDGVFADEIEARLDAATDELAAAQRLRAASIAHKIVREEGQEYTRPVSDAPYDDAGPVHQPDARTDGGSKTTDDYVDVGFLDAEAESDEDDDRLERVTDLVQLDPGGRYRYDTDTEVTFTLRQHTDSQYRLEYDHGFDYVIEREQLARRVRETGLVVVSEPGAPAGDAR